MKTQLANLFTQKTYRQNVPVAMAPDSGGGGGTARTCRHGSG